MAFTMRAPLIVALTAAAFAAGFSLGPARGPEALEKQAIENDTRGKETREPLVRFTPLLATSKTVMDEQIVYPQGTAKLTTGIVALAPGDETGWHTHGMPLTGIVLDGELTVDYGGLGKKVFRKGQSIAEAIAVPHNGRNTGTDTMRLFAVFIGAEGVALSAPAAAGQPPPTRTPPANP